MTDPGAGRYSTLERDDCVAKPNQILERPMSSEPADVLVETMNECTPRSDPTRHLAFLPLPHPCYRGIEDSIDLRVVNDRILAAIYRSDGLMRPLELPFPSLRQLTLLSYL